MKISEYKDVKRSKKPGRLQRGFGRDQETAPRDAKHRDRTKYKRKPKHSKQDY